MKQSIAKKVTRRVSLMLLIALAILYIGSFFLVHHIIYVKSQNYASAIVSIYSDLAAYTAHSDDVPLDFSHAEIATRHGDYVCKWYGIDYAYMYIPDTRNDTLKFISIAQNKNTTKTPLQNNMTGYIMHRALSRDEMAVWNGSRLFAHTIRKNSFGNELSTILRVEDSFGNKVIAGVDLSYAKIYKQIFALFSILAVIIMLVLIGVYFSVYMIIKKHVSRPAQEISLSMQQFIKDGKRSFVKLEEKGPDEYSMIASAFNNMTSNIDSYLNDIQLLTREKEHQATELEIAARIQRGFLPGEYFKTQNFEIYASMTPAKDVGGDLYDYLPLDNSRILLVIADVSGKGISAAIFMAVTLMLIRQFAKLELSPSEILSKTNNILSENNAALLFATAFIGIYDCRTKCLTYSNAGHNPPYIAGNKITVLDQASGTLLGLFENERYSDATVQLNIGDCIFMYTDGVTEAINRQNQFYGNKRLVNELRNFKTGHADSPVSFIADSVKSFSGGAEQHDDITMLALCVKDSTELILNADINDFSKIKSAILALSIPRQQQLCLCLAAEECFVNICSYAFSEDTKKTEKIKFTIDLKDKITMQFEDGGQPYDPTKNLADPGEYDIDNNIGGLGNLIAFSNVDDVKYEYKDQKNILTLTKFLKEEK